MDKWRGKVALVTGASSGMGAAIVRALVHHGMVVIGLARREDKVKVRHSCTMFDYCNLFVLLAMVILCCEKTAIQ